MECISEDKSFEVLNKFVQLSVLLVCFLCHGDKWEQGALVTSHIHPELGMQGRLSPNYRLVLMGSC